MTHSAGAFTICPHCNARINNGNLARHRRGCIQDPAVRVRVIAAISSAPGIAKTREEYATDHGDAPPMKSLMDQLGMYSWQDVVEHFGLRFMRQYNHATPGSVPGRSVVQPPPPQKVAAVVCGLPIAHVEAREYLAERRVRRPDGMWLEVRRVHEERYVLL